MLAEHKNTTFRGDKCTLLTRHTGEASMKGAATLAIL